MSVRISQTIVLAILMCAISIGCHSRQSHASELTTNGAQQLAVKIDEHIARHWSEAAVKPASTASDAEYMRRAFLDIAGKIPPGSEVREFLDDVSPDKRQKLVDRLLNSPKYIAHFTNVWRAAMIPEAGSDIQVRFLVPTFEAWLREKLTNDDSYAEIVREILTVKLDQRQGFNPYGQQNNLTPLTFYQAKQLKPESIAASVARTFLGVRIECAQCHDHPFDTWRQDDFWSFAAFFAGIERMGTPEQGLFGPFRELHDRRELLIPETDRVMQAAYLDGNEPQWRFREGPRSTLADWVASGKNPYFARAAVNRLWAHFFGVGIVDPIDDFGDAHPPSHPELLEDLTEAFVRHDFDVKFLIRAITASRTYGLSSALTHPSQQDPRLFARSSIRGLSAEQLFSSLSQATGHYEQFNVRNQFDFANTSARSQFFETFSGDGQQSEAPQLSILQALAMMNSSLTADATSLEKSTTLAAIAEFPLADTADRVEAVYLAALSRKPKEHELTQMVSYVDSGGPKDDPKRALADVFWALLNSSEFMFNH